MRGFNSSVEFQAHLNHINALANDNGDTLFMIQMRMLKGGGKYGAAVSAWMDLLPDHQNTDGGNLHNRIFDALNMTAAEPQRFKETEEEWNRQNTQNHVWENSFPSQFESYDRRNSFGVLIDMLEKSPQFRTDSYEEIADILFKPYVVYDGGGQLNHIYKVNDLRRMNIEIDDLYDNQNYAMILALKEGKELALEIEEDKGFMADKPMLERLKALKDDFLKEDNDITGDASIWTATQPSSDGESMELVLMGGDMNDRNKRRVLARWHYRTINEKGKPILKRLTYDGTDRQLRLLSAYKRGNFMDIDNDGQIKDTVKRWIKEGPSTFVKSIPGGLEEVAIRKLWPWKIGKFEYDQVVKPFWDKYKDLSDKEFALKWEEVRRNETYSFEEKFFDLSFEGLIDTYRPDIVPFRNGAGRHSKSDDPLGNRGKRHKNWLMLKRSGGQTIGGRFKKSGRGGFLNENKEGKIDPFGLQEKLLGD